MQFLGLLNVKYGPAGGWLGQNTGSFSLEVKKGCSEHYYTLISQAKGELARLLLAAGNIDYEDFRCI